MEARIVPARGARGVGERASDAHALLGVREDGSVELARPQHLRPRREPREDEGQTTSCGIGGDRDSVRRMLHRLALVHGKQPEASFNEAI